MDRWALLSRRPSRQSGRRRPRKFLLKFYDFFRGVDCLTKAMLICETPRDLDRICEKVKLTKDELYDLFDDEVHVNKFEKDIQGASRLMSNNLPNKFVQRERNVIKKLMGAMLKGQMVEHVELDGHVLVLHFTNVVARCYVESVSAKTYYKRKHGRV